MQGQHEGADVEPDQPDSAALLDKQQTLARHLTRLTDDLERTAAAIELLLSEPPLHAEHFAAESVRLAATAQRQAQMAVTNLTFTARQPPHQVPLQRLADLVGVSLNTLRSRMRLPGSRRPVDDVRGETLADF